ncbi:MAG: hypothetical protein A2174_02410 [Candidatus Portnoybacteria bacterium RBG_13_41_18]|uniref:Glycosyl transferase family 1 domain-containing protein n=1 Tax=Candidatus Portnoybacteria bacterium RBG_13_41_18 TaxID=1801991 RepID=A0A1G2FAV2_9BACT|nr:MAG: hypothetical protein A2174_02410 [Candidatus Portnoybacteria bacterium RBG_13_41_18]
MKKADGIRVVSQRVKKSLGQMGVAEEKISEVPIYTDNTVLLPERSPQGEVEGLEDPSMRPVKIGAYSGNKKIDKFIFLTVGRLVKVKNIKMQIEAMTETIKQRPDAELWIVGDGPERQKLKVKSYELKVESNIKFLGWQVDLENFYRQADVFLLTSNYEGWGLAAVEAASYGLPIIMTNVGCAGELIKDGINGLVVPVGDQKKLTEAMGQLIVDKELREALGQNAAKSVRNLLNKEENLALYKKSFEL